MGAPAKASESLGDAPNQRLCLWWFIVLGGFYFHEFALSPAAPAASRGNKLGSLTTDLSLLCDSNV